MNLLASRMQHSLLFLVALIPLLTIHSNSARASQAVQAEVDCGKTYSLTEAWRRGDEPDELIFGKLSDILVFNNQVVVLDTQLNQIQVFSTEGEHLGVLGEEGEGPGKLLRSTNLVYLSEESIGVFQSSPPHISEFSLATMMWLRDIQIPKSLSSNRSIYNIKQFGEMKIAVGATTTMLEEGMKQTVWLASLDESWELEAFCHEEQRELSFTKIVIDEEVFDTFERRWVVSDSFGLAYAVPHTGYRVDYWLRPGERSHVEQVAYEPLKRSADQRNQIRSIMERLGAQIPKEIRVSKHDPDIIRLLNGPDGRLWVLSSRGLKPRDPMLLCSFDIIGHDGVMQGNACFRRPAAEIDLAWDLTAFHDDRFYILSNRLDALMAAAGGSDDADVDSGAEQMELICFELD